MEKSGFFNSNEGDRMYAEEFFAEFFGSFIGNGVYPNPSTGCQVIATGDMTVAVSEGQAWINGRYYHNTDNRIFDLDIADGVLKRIDRIVLRHTTLDREIKAYVKKGTFASTPVAPSLQRDADAYELGIADVFIENGVVSVTQANITDLRLNSTYCGIVHGVIDQVDTTTIFNQFQAWYAETIDDATTDIATMLSAFQNSFNIWFANIQDILDENAAGNLLNKINDLIARMAAAETAISNLQKFQTAGGTGTAITLTGIELIDGFQTTFVILASNSGAATTINGKPLYKPGTTTSPKLIAGKATTVWYNLAGDCFFIKASAEGTATAGDVLAGQTFSNDDDIGLIGTLALTGDAVADDVFLGKTFYKNDPKNKLTGTNPYKSGNVISYDALRPEPPLVPNNDFVPQLYASLESLDYDEYSDRLMVKITASGTGYLYVYDVNGVLLKNFAISGSSSVFRVVFYANNYFVFSNSGWAKYNAEGTLITSGTDFVLSTGDTDLRMERLSEYQVKAYQGAGARTIKKFNLNTLAVEQTINITNIYTGTFPFFDDDGNWYYQGTSMQLTKLDTSGSVVFSGVANNFENGATATYKPFCIEKNNSILSARVYNGYFRSILVSTVDGSLINSQIVQVSTDTGLQCAYPNLFSSKKLLVLRGTSTYYLHVIKLDDQAQGLPNTFKILLTTSNSVNGVYANGDDAFFASYLISGYPAVKKIQFNYQLS